MKSTTLFLVIMALLLVTFSASLPPTVEAAPPKALKTFPGSLDPGGITDPPLNWQLNRDVSEFLFHYAVTGGAEPGDVAYVTIVETGDSWQSPTGEGWFYCDCFLSAGSYSVTVEADEAASDRISYDIGFYLAPQPPVDFGGFNRADSPLASNSFAVSFQSATSHQILLGVTAGSYEFFVDGESKGVVNTTTELSIDFTSGLHVFDVSLGEGDVGWSVQILGQPKLEAQILNLCPTLNPESGQSKCVTGAEATASDGRTPTVSYQWSASGGSFNSTSSQWVEWTAPPGVADFTLTVQASAPGYTSGTDSITARVVPEFPSVAFPFLIAVALTFVLAARRARYMN